MIIIENNKKINEQNKVTLKEKKITVKTNYKQEQIKNNLDNNKTK